LPKHLQTPGLYDVMRTRGGAKLARMSDTALSNILKAWGFSSKSLGSSRGWEAPQLPDLRTSISEKFPAVEFDSRIEWIAHDQQDSEDPGAGAGGARAANSTADTGNPDDADLALDEMMGRREQDAPNTSGQEEPANPTPGVGAGGTRTANGREREKHNLDDGAASFPGGASKTGGRGKPANPMVDPTTGMPSAAAVIALVKAS
jgi:hypothetical protein